MTDLMTTTRNLIEKGETLTVEFKSDRKCLADRDLMAAVVALTNTDGGVLLLGVEDDGKITGLQPPPSMTLKLPTSRYQSPASLLQPLKEYCSVDA